MHAFDLGCLRPLFLSCIAASVLRPALMAQAPQTPTDRRIEVGGYSLHLKCLGHGSPVVIFESGLGGNADSWAKVMPEVSQETRTCSYDRANVGASDPAPRPTIRAKGRTYLELRSGDEIVRDLHVLLQNAGELGPYILVGHSLGGLYAILYAAQYPSGLVGIVLEDSAHPDQVARYGAIVGIEKARLDRESLIQNDEGVDILSVFQEVKSLHWQTNVPLVVLSQGSLEQTGKELSPEQWKDHRDEHLVMQKTFLGMSTNSKLVTADKSGHLIHRDQPELVVNAVRDVLTTLSKSASSLQ